MRVCHLDTCPVGIATQNPELRSRYTGRAEHVVAFFEFIAQEVRELLASLGLAITFGLMRVINMAHGEMLMIGAYATYVTQRLFASYWPAGADWYLLAAVPAAVSVLRGIGSAR